jgi:hypothetical protein
VVPTNGNCVVIKHHVTIDQNIGTTSNGIGWIRIETGGNLDVDTNSHTIYFGSTGTNASGSGSQTNPGADATMFGFFVAAGTLNLTGGSAAAPVTITTGNNSSPFYIQHEFNAVVGCTTITANVCNGAAGHATATITLKYDTLTPVVGTAAAGFEGVHHELNNGSEVLNIQNCKFVGLNQINIVSSDTHVTISNNYFTGTTNASTITANTNSGATGWIVTNNTESGATTAGQFWGNISNAPGMTFTGNAELGTATITRALAQFPSQQFTGFTVNGNFCYNPANASLPTIRCIDFETALTDSTSTINNNVLVGSYNNLYITSGSPTVTGNFMLGHSDQVAGQGVIIDYGVASQASGNTVTLKNNIIGLDTATGTSQIGLLFTTNATLANSNVFLVNHNSFFQPSGSDSLWLAEGNNVVQGAIVNSYFRNNIVTGGAVGITDGNRNSTWTATGNFNSAAVHHNLTFNNTTAYQHTGTVYSTGFDNGSTPHPNALYADLTVDPRYINSSATPATFAVWCKVGGTADVAALFVNLGAQSFGGTYNANCSIANLLTYLQFSYTPMNGRLKNAGASADCPTACDIGAVPVYPATAMVAM